MYACPECDSEWTSELVAAECCDPAYDALLDRGRE